jgi:hypothetical protein
MNHEWEQFCKTLKMEHWDNAQAQWAKLDEEGSS